LFKGNSNSAKVEGIVKCLLNIIKQDKHAKCIVFSEHVTMLDLIIDLIKDNLISYKYIKDNTNLEKNISEFKSDKNINVLFMPYSYGSNGLNLTEATHVLLVEPTLNKSQEIQAVGRVHRIGQTKPTFVHRFLIRNSIEELVYKMFKSGSNYGDAGASSSSKSDTEKMLTIGDVKTLFQNL
jgi:E3 ubiquitin-protein ligase SHPRH